MEFKKAEYRWNEQTETILVLKDRYVINGQFWVEKDAWPEKVDGFWVIWAFTGVTDPATGNYLWIKCRLKSKKICYAVEDESQPWIVQFYASLNGEEDYCCDD